MAEEKSSSSGYKSPIASAIARINQALDGLEAAAENQPQPMQPGEELQRMSADRARLARELDAQKARSDRLSEVNSEVSKRLVGVMETVRHVLDDDSQSG
ncbi:MAG: DUF4164 domain-containing protein [Ahrensia sp.]|nr:DUF4164 domain-containing protein [Ahrensia sp.]